MLIINSNFKDIKSGGIFALGNFDGVHLGHKQILKETKSVLVEVNDKFILQADKVQKIMKDNGFEMTEKKQSKLIAESKEVKNIFNQKLIMMLSKQIKLN